MSNKDRFRAEISSFPAWRNNLERRERKWEGEGKGGEKRREKGSGFPNVTRITDAKPGPGAMFWTSEELSSRLTRNVEC